MRERYMKSPQEKGVGMEILSFNLSEVKYDLIKYVVLIAEYKEQLVIIRNKNKTIWELPGGKREEGEQILKAASRELFEETGATDFELTPYGIYLMNGSYGMNFYVKIVELGKLPDYEIAEIKFCNSLPDGLGYGDIYYNMHRDWIEIKNRDNLSKYRVQYKDVEMKYEF